MEDVPIILNHNIDENYIDVIRKLLHLDNSVLAHAAIIKPKTSKITLDQIRELKTTLYVSRSKKQVIIFERFESATLEAQNAMLKLLEDTLGNNTYYLCTTAAFSIIDTIRSRCKVIYSQTTLSDYIKKTSLVDDLLNKKTSVLSQKKYIMPKRDDAVDSFRNILHELKQHYANGSLWAVKSTRLAVRLYSLLLKNNINSQLAIDHWVISTLKFIKNDSGQS